MARRAAPRDAPPEPVDDKLARYRGKRDFTVTAEPGGGAGHSVAGQRYLIQKHAARRLHYDLRLELDGVLKSWAVPQGPSLDPGQRRLAVHVEDHPLDYGDFEGTIPQGEYGGGTVMLWDTGSWEPLADPHEGYAKGNLKFRLHGQRLEGEWVLVRMGGRRRDKGKDLWLLIKHADATADRARHVTSEDDRSIVSGRSMKEIAAGSEGTSQRTASAGSDLPPPPPSFIEPQLARLVDRAPQGQEWLHEIKWDGYRCQIRIAGREVAVRTRGGHVWTDRFTPIARAAGKLGTRSALIDAEVTVLDDRGISSFAKLKEALETGRKGDLTAYAFDLLFHDGEDLRPRPLLERKERLAALLVTSVQDAGLHYSDHVRGDGPGVYREACRLGAEGIIAKRADTPYRSGRGDAWLKVKCENRQEVVVAGYTRRQGKAGTLGALVVGVHDGGRLVAVGRVGTGWDEPRARELLDAFEPLAADAMPFDRLPAAARRGVTWLRPELVVEVRFAGWTGDGQLRQASYQGIREDREAASVVREEAAAPAATKTDALAAVPTETKGGRLIVAGVGISSPDRVILDEPLVRKGDVARYYAAVGQHILPEIAGRPLSAIRCPERLDEGCFYQRHRARGMPESVREVKVKGRRGHEPYLAIDDLDGLLALVQFGAVELHPWGSRADRPDRPDRLIFDLDPAEDVAWARVMDAARELGDRLADKRLRSFVKTTGGKGLHVVVPIDRRYDWPPVKRFSSDLAHAMAKDSPKAYTATLSKAARKGRIFIDYLRNDQGSTAVAAWSLRSRPGATVAVPIAWERLDQDFDPKALTLFSVASSAGPDPWSEMRTLRQKLPRLA